MSDAPSDDIQAILSMTNGWITKRYEEVTGKTVTDFLTEAPSLRLLDNQINTAAQQGDLIAVKDACRAYCALWKTVIDAHKEQSHAMRLPVP